MVTEVSAGIVPKFRFEVDVVALYRDATRNHGGRCGRCLRRRLSHDLRARVHLITLRRGLLDEDAWDADHQLNARAEASAIIAVPKIDTNHRFMEGSCVVSAGIELRACATSPSGCGLYRP